MYQRRALLSLIFNEMHESLRGLVAYANKSTLRYISGLIKPRGFRVNIFVRRIT